MRTWEDLERIARGLPWDDQPYGLIVTPPALLQAMRMVESGKWTREEALIELAYALLESHHRIVQERVNELMMRTKHPVVLNGQS